MRSSVFLFGLALAILSPEKARAVTELKIMEWEGYFSFLKEDFEKYAKDLGKDYKLTVVQPSITDADQLFQTIRAQDVDVCTPSSSFFKGNHGKLFKVLQPVDAAKVANFGNLPAAIQKAQFSRDEQGKLYGIPFLAGPYGLAYNTDRVKVAPTSWEVLWKPENVGKYSVNKETADVNVYVAAMVDGTPASKVWDYDTIDTNKVQKRLDSLAKNAGYIWGGHGTPLDEMKKLDYVTTWLFDVMAANKAGQHWKVAKPKERESIWLDSLALTVKAGKDPAKTEAFYLLANYALSTEVQLKFLRVNGSVPLNKEVAKKATAQEIEEFHVGDESYFNEDLIWKPLSDRTSGAYTKMWNDALKTREKNVTN